MSLILLTRSTRLPSQRVTVTATCPPPGPLIIRLSDLEEPMNRVTLYVVIQLRALQVLAPACPQYRYPQRSWPSAWLPPAPLHFYCMNIQSHDFGHFVTSRIKVENTYFMDLRAGSRAD